MRRLLLAAATSLATACSAPESPKAAASPPAPAALAVHVAVVAEASPAAAAWAKELETAVAAMPGELELVADAGAAGLVVRIVSVEQARPTGPDPAGEGEALVMHGAFVVGEATREFNITYRGEARAQAEALARNLRRYAEQIEAQRAAPPAKGGE